MTYPNSDFGKNLKTTAELINSGVESRVFYLALSGFDTHVRQHEQQQRLFTDLGDGLAALADDLRQHDQWNNTLVLVFSEFGRRVGQNASNGTDHGTANNVFLAGGALPEKRRPQRRPRPRRTSTRATCATRSISAASTPACSRTGLGPMTRPFSALVLSGCRDWCRASATRSSA